MTRRKRPPLSLREAVILLGMALPALAIAGALMGADIRWSALAPGGGSFLSAWNGARTLLFQSQNPYDLNTAVATQDLVYGAEAPRGANPYWLDIPPFLLPFYFPFALLPSPEIARGIWAFLGQLAVVGAIFLSFRIGEWRPSRLFTVAFGVLAAFSYYTIAALAEGTSAVMLTLAYVAILWAMQSGQDEFAGALSVLCLHRWEVGLLFLILVTWRTFHERRWRIIAGFGMSVSILLALSFLLQPGWILPFLTATVAMMRSPHGISTAAAWTRLSPDHGSQIATGLTIGILVMLIVEWALGRSGDFRRFVWVALLGLAAAPLVGFRTEIASLVVLLPCFVLVSASAIERGNSRVWLGILVALLAFVIPWALLIGPLVPDQQRVQDLLLLYYPCVAILGMYWTRWWYLRPGRTWLDEVRAARS